MKRPQFLIEANIAGHNLRFKTTYGIFSYREIDKGTALLIKHLDIPIGAACLDLGCGYGPIGITLGKKASQGSVTMVDRDFIAVEYANKNAKLNKLENTQAVLSDGCSNIGKTTFDLIASNLPYHTSHDMLTWLLYDCKHHMKKGGEMYVVAMNKLTPFIRREFENIFGNYKKVAFDRMYTISSSSKE